MIVLIGNRWLSIHRTLHGEENRAFMVLEVSFTTIMF